jgi:hypothetical protein
VDLDGVFQAGQAYVALSRAMAPNTLVVRNFDARKVYASQAVLDFYVDNVKHLDGSTSIPAGVVCGNRGAIRIHKVVICIGLLL